MALVRPIVFRHSNTEWRIKKYVCLQISTDYAFISIIKKKSSVWLKKKKQEKYFGIISFIIALVRALLFLEYICLYGTLSSPRNICNSSVLNGCEIDFRLLNVSPVIHHDHSSTRKLSTRHSSKQTNVFPSSNAF